MSLGDLVEEQVLLNPLKLTIKRKTKPNVVMYFKNFDGAQIFHEFIKELIEAVKKKATKENPK